MCRLHIALSIYTTALYVQLAYVWSPQASLWARIRITQPRCHILREACSVGADRLEMAAPPAELFLDAVTDVVRSNLKYIPPHGRGSLYLRPLLLGSGPILGLGPAPDFTFLIFAAAVGTYFKAGPSAPVLTIHCFEDGQKEAIEALQQPNFSLMPLQTGQSTPIDLLVETKFHRAAPGGMGGTKAAGNYSPVCYFPETRPHTWIHYSARSRYRLPV